MSEGFWATIGVIAFMCFGVVLLWWTYPRERTFTQEEIDADLPKKLGYIPWEEAERRYWG